MMFKIGQETYILPPERVFHNKIRKEFTTLATWAKDEFKNLYKLNFNDIDEVEKGVLNLGILIIEDVILRGRDILEKEEILLSKETLIIECKNILDAWEEECRNILSLNLTFRNPMLMASFIESISKLSFEINEIVIAKIISEKGEIISRAVTEGDKERVNELLNKYREIDFTEKQIFELLNLNPYDAEVHKLLINKYGDENKDIEKLCYLMEIDYYILKGELLEEYYEMLPISSESEVIESKKLFIKYGEYINFKAYDKYIEILDEKLKKCVEIEDENFLEETFIVDNIKTEEDGGQLLTKLASIEIRTEELKKKKQKEIEDKIEKLLEENDERKIRKVIDSYIFLNVEKVYDAIEEVADLEVRNEWTKEKACEYLSENSEKLVKRHRELLERAKRYKNDILLQNVSEEGVIVSLLKRVFKRKVEEFNQNRIERDKEAYNFITNFGERDLDEM